jgi:hypothetical protein
MERFTETWTLIPIHWRVVVIHARVSKPFRVCMTWDDTNIDCHVVPQVFIPSDEGVSAVVFEAHTTGGSLIDTIKILDGGHDGIGGIMREDLDSHRDSRTNLGVLIQQQLKGNVLWRGTAGRWVLKPVVDSVAVEGS